MKIILMRETSVYGILYHVQKSPSEMLELISEEKCRWCGKKERELHSIGLKRSQKNGDSEHCVSKPRFAGRALLQSLTKVVSYSNGYVPETITTLAMCVLAIHITNTHTILLHISPCKSLCTLLLGDTLILLLHAPTRLTYGTLSH